MPTVPSYSSGERGVYIHFLLANDTQLRGLMTSGLARWLTEFLMKSVKKEWSLSLGMENERVKSGRYI